MADLQKVIDSLGAVEVAPGFYAMKAPDKWITFNLKALEGWAKGPQNHVTCDVKIRRNGAVMPEWWRPDRRFAWRVRGNKAHLGPFDSLEIFRWRPSVTQGEVKILHRGAEVAHFGDHIRLDVKPAEEGSEVIAGWSGRGDAFWVERITADLETGEEIPA